MSVGGTKADHIRGVHKINVRAFRSSWTNSRNTTRHSCVCVPLLLQLCFSHTLAASLLPGIGLLLFNGGGPDFHLITALT